MENVFLLDYNEESQTATNKETRFDLNKDQRSASIKIIRTTEFDGFIGFFRGIEIFRNFHEKMFIFKAFTVN